MIGDINSRIGDKIDYVPSIDSIPIRKTLDKTVNKHGDVFYRLFVGKQNVHKITFI